MENTSWLLLNYEWHDLDLTLHRVRILDEFKARPDEVEHIELDLVSAVSVGLASSDWI
jgi:hypothetical protein